MLVTNDKLAQKQPIPGKYSNVKLEACIVRAQFLRHAGQPFPDNAQSDERLSTLWTVETAVRSLQLYYGSSRRTFWLVEGGAAGTTGEAAKLTSANEMQNRERTLNNEIAVNPSQTGIWDPTAGPSVCAAAKPPLPGTPVET